MKLATTTDDFKKYVSGYKERVQYVCEAGFKYIDKAIDDVDAATWLSNKKVEMGISPDDFEHITLSDMDGFNVHLSVADGIIHSGADLSPEMQLRYVAPDKVNERIQSFYNDTDSIVFGCAGLKGILTEKVKTQSLGLFLYGEICTLNQRSNFSNLMLSKLRIKRK